MAKQALLNFFIQKKKDTPFLTIAIVIKEITTEVIPKK